MLRLVFLSGMRISEAIALRIDDLSVDAKYGAMIVHIRSGKGNKERRVSVPYSCPESAEDENMEYESAKSAVENDKPDWCIEPYYKAYMKIRARKDKVLFCDERGKELYQRKIDQVFRTALTEAGIKKSKMGLHLLRHSNASYIYRNTHDIMLVKERLGHEAVQTTERYTHMSEDELKRSVEAFRGKREMGGKL